MSCVGTNFKQNMMFTKTKPSQHLGAASPDPRTWDLLLGIYAPPENFLPTPQELDSIIPCIYNTEFSHCSILTKLYSKTLKEWNHLPMEIIEQENFFSDKLFHFCRPIALLQYPAGTDL